MKGVFIDNDQTLNYETNSFLRKLVNIFFIPVLHIMSASVIRPMRKINRTANDMVAYAGTHKAMEIIYNPDAHPSEGFISDRFLQIWLMINNSKAVRNRLRLVKREIKRKIIQLAKDNREIKIISIAAGSARAILESTDEVLLDDNVRLSATFIDRNHEAILCSQKLAVTHKFHDTFQWVEDSVESFLNSYNGVSKYNIAEIVGVLEYLNDDEIIRMFSAANKLLESDGILITTNVLDNPEKRFMSDAIGWKMNYRSVEKLTSLLIDAGFQFCKMKIYYEPLKIHCVVVAQK